MFTMSLKLVYEYNFNLYDSPLFELQLFQVRHLELVLALVCGLFNINYKAFISNLEYCEYLWKFHESHSLKQNTNQTKQKNKHNNYNGI